MIVALAFVHFCSQPSDWKDKSRRSIRDKINNS